MYTYPSTAAVALRAKWSFYHPHLPLSSDDDYNHYGYAYCSQSSLFAVPRNPRLICYGLLPARRRSAVFRLEPSRTFLIQRRRTLRVSDGGFDEVIGLLAPDSDRCCRCCRCCDREGLASEDRDFERSSRNEGSTGVPPRDSSRNERDFRKDSSLSGDFEGSGAERRRRGRVDVDEDFARNARNETKRKGFGNRVRNEEEPRVRNGSSSSSSSSRSRVEYENAVDCMDSGRRRREQDDRDEQKARRDQYYSDVKNVDRGESWSSLVKRQNEVDKQVVAQADLRNKKSVGVTRDERTRNDRKMVDKVEVTNQYDRANRSKSYLENRWDDEMESSSRRRFEEERLAKDREERSNSVKNFIGVTRDERMWQNEQRAFDKVQVNEQHDTNVGDSRFRSSDAERGNSSRGYLEIRKDEEERLIKGREERTATMKNLVHVTREERSRVDERAIDKVELNERYETDVIDSRFRASDTRRDDSSKSSIVIKRDDERASSSLMHYEEERMKSREEKSTSVENLVRLRRDERTQVDQQVTNKVDASNQFENLSNISSSIHASSTERASNSNIHLRIRADDRKEHLTSAVNLVHGARTNSRVEIERVSNLQEVSTTRTEDEQEASLSVSVQDEYNRQRSNLIGENLQSTSIQMGISGSSHGGSSSGYQAKNGAIESASRYDESSAMYVEEFVDKVRHETLDFDSSEVEADQETTYAEVGMDDDVTRHGKKYIDESGRQFSSGIVIKGPSDEMWEVRGMSSQEHSKIEEEEEAAEEEPEESHAAEVMDSNTSPGMAETAISRSSHRSLWTYIADIMKIGWAHRAGSHSSANKSGGKTSSNDSISSGTWFSGHEPDDDEHEKKDSDVLPKEALPSRQPVEQSQVNVSVSVNTKKGGSSRKTISPAEEIEWSEVGKGRQGTLASITTTGQSFSVLPGSTTSPSLTGTGNDHMHRSSAPKSEKEVGRQKQPVITGAERRHVELRKRIASPKESTPPESDVEQSNLGPSTSMDAMRRASSSKGVALVSRPEKFESCEDEKGVRGNLSSVDQSSVLTAVMAPPSLPEIESIQMVGSELPMLEKVPNEEKLAEVGGTEGREAELKRRKLQRNKQVLREDFVEWEEAYKRENEQRKIDEFFMREALVEAKKAADTWEVPVGAVLVRNGKIIARGCNLVEELRDSTAHAEMICIREASNLLRTWRLAETTLYVTLEPCPMCAGAILQARIDTVVWGAPNKLLGADGSWVRLFPTGDGGGGSLDPTNQMAGPVHPFHPKIKIRRGVLATECSDAMQQFFQLRRRNNKKQEPPLPPPPCVPMSSQPTKLLTRMHNIFSAMFCL